MAAIGRQEVRAGWREPILLPGIFRPSRSSAAVAYTSRRIRRIGGLHTLAAFSFGTAMLASMINLAANFL